MSTTETLDGAGTAYETRRFAPDLSAEAAAGSIGLPLEAIFKTLVCETVAGSIVLACLPVPAKLDMKKLEGALGEPVAGLVGRANLERRTGFTAGAVTPIPMPDGRRYPVVLDASATLHPVIAVGGGEAGLEILLHPEALVAICKAAITTIRSA